MDQVSGNALLLRFINSSHFNIYYSISYLIRYSDVIGIQHYICNKLSTNFSLDELKFFIPQFIQILLTVESDSLALEELIKELCSRDVHFSILTFWHLQANIQELSKDSGSLSFQICKRLLNDLQYELFNIQSYGSSVNGASGVVKAQSPSMFRENVAPSIILAAGIALSVGLPQINKHIAPIVKVQGKLSKSFVFEVVKGLQKQLNRNLTLKNTKKNASLTRRIKSDDDYSTDEEESNNAAHKKTSSTDSARLDYQLSRTSLSDLDFGLIDKYADENLPHLKKSLSSNSLIKTRAHRSDSLNNLATLQKSPLGEAVSSMPNLTTANSSTFSSLTIDDAITPMASKEARYSSDIESIYEPSTPKRKSSLRQAVTTLSTKQKIKLLKSNYFKCETQFAIALQNISMKLSQVPKEARLSALRAELSMLNKDLPCETDIPVLFPSNSKGKLHKIVRIPPNESAVLNSAERVPFLLLIEFLSDEVDFNPSSSSNDQLLRDLTKTNDHDNKFSPLKDSQNSPQEVLKDRKYVFDLAGSMHTTSQTESRSQTPTYLRGDLGTGITSSESVSETDLADFSVVKLSNKNENEVLRAKNFIRKVSDVPIIPPENSDKVTQEGEDLPVVRNEDLSFLSHYKLEDGESPNSYLVTQMRIAAVMLTQLDSSSSQLPQAQTAAIKARLIASMQALQDNFGSVSDLEDIHGAAGERKLENDLKLGGVKSEMNNQSNYYLGEDWAAKKERIRKESMFGHLENWDLCSVIAKTGDDLTQEAFACQLIQAMSQIWARNNVGVWVKKMRILVTSSNTGLVETITNALSIHSIKKALTQYQIEDNENVKGNIATLKDHFIKTFGDVDSMRYKRAQDNFTKSLAASSIICYILQIKDRHNGNIMLDNEGHIIHIDFGFLLSNSPGSVGFEAAPFKLTLEYIEILGGTDSYFYKKFVSLMKEGFRCIRKNAENLITMVELMQKDSSLPCFKSGDNTSIQLRQRLQLHLTDDECDAFVENVLIGKSAGSIYTRLYDQFQLLTQGIYS